MKLAERYAQGDCGSGPGNESAHQQHSLEPSGSKKGGTTGAGRPLCVFCNVDYRALIPFFKGPIISRLDSHSAVVRLVGTDRSPGTGRCERQNLASATGLNCGSRCAASKGNMRRFFFASIYLHGCFKNIRARKKVNSPKGYFL
jgi:hypothetical protein